MADISLKDAIGQVLAVLREAFEGSPNPWSFFTDGAPDTALFGTLAKLSAAEASRPVGGTSIAAHVHHTNFGLGAAAKWIRGDKSPSDWAESWCISTVDDAAWSRLQQQARDGYNELRQAIEANAASSVDAMGGAVGAVAHVAYHLGAIRQKTALVRKP